MRRENVQRSPGQVCLSKLPRHSQAKPIAEGQMLIIFDFDGVVADSERLANEILAAGLSGIGLDTTTEQAMGLYMGRRWADCLPMIEERLGAPLPDGFLAAQVAATHSELLAQVQPVQGVQRFLEQFNEVPRCIASSSKLEYIGLCLERLELAEWFKDRFSGQDVARGKPYPDLFLKAAQTLGATASSCIVIEDSPTGVMAGRAAGMWTVGLCAGSHAAAGHAARLSAAGADFIAMTYDDLAAELASRAVGQAHVQGGS